MKASDSDPKSAQYKGCTRVKATLTVPLNRLAPDRSQPRKEFDPESLERLAQSLKDKGQLLPIRARWDEELGRWVIISGERRYRAAKLAGLKAVQCIECEVPISEEDVLEEQLIENRHREDLKPIEQARAFRTLMDRRGWSARQLARALYLSESSVSRALVLLDLPDGVRERVESGELPASVAYEISKVADPVAQQALADRVVGEKLNRSQAVAAIRQSTDQPTNTARPRREEAKGATSAPPERGRRASARRSVVERTYARGTVQISVRFQTGEDIGTFLELLDELRGQAMALFGAGDETQAA